MSDLNQLANDANMLLSELSERFSAALRDSIKRLNAMHEITRPELLKTIIETCDDVIDGTNVVRIKAQGLANRA